MSLVSTRNRWKKARSRMAYIRASQRSGGWWCCCYVGVRLARYRLWPWITLAIAPFHLLFSSGGQRAYAQIRVFRALSRIDFGAVYGLLEDLLW